MVSIYWTAFFNYYLQNSIVLQCLLLLRYLRNLFDYAHLHQQNQIDFFSEEMCVPEEAENLTNCYAI